VFILRTAKGQSPMVPDRNHIHHRLLDSGLSHRQSTLTLLATNVLFTIAAIIMQPLGNLLSFMILLLSACILNLILYKVYQRVARFNAESTDDQKDSKQVYLSKSA
ncbi:MAG: hypothetical protein AAFO69_00400, partial [Bacteroidota bacterium]